MVALSMTLSDL